MEKTKQIVFNYLEKTIEDKLQKAEIFQDKKDDSYYTEYENFINPYEDILNDDELFYDLFVEEIATDKEALNEFRQLIKEVIL